MFHSLLLFLLCSSFNVLGKAILDEALNLDILNAQPSETIDFLVQLTPSEDMSHISKLKDHATTSQRTLISELESLKAQGLVSRYQNYFISNTVAVSGNAEIIKQLMKMENIEEISPNRKFRTKLSSFNEKEAIMAKNVPWTGEEQHWSLDYIKAANLDSSVMERASDLIYANADTGVEFDHPALSNNYLGRYLSSDSQTLSHDYSWWDANKQINSSHTKVVCRPNSQQPCDDNNHGTHTMSTVVGGMGLGLSPKTKWMACRNMDMNFGSPESYLGCLQFFLAPTNLKGEAARSDLRPHVIGNSYGCPPEEGCSQTTFKYAIRALRAAGIMMVVSAGNDGTKGCSSVTTPPATDPGAFNVAASRYLSSARAPFSSLGPVLSRSHAIDVTAPGVNITGAVRGGKFDQYQGTSMAAPHVSGAALLIMAACPHLLRQVTAVEQLLRNTATPQAPILGCGDDTKGTTDRSPNNEFGYGVIDVARAIRSCQAST